jgi:hypothetical protein
VALRVVPRRASPADVHDALDAGHVSNFYTPKTAVEALSFLAQYRNNQAWLPEVPPPQPEPQPPDLAPLKRCARDLLMHAAPGSKAAKRGTFSLRSVSA